MTKDNNTNRKIELFTIKTINGFTSVFKRASTYESEWGNFSGSGQKIPEDDNSEPPSDKPCQSHNKMRDSHDNLRRLHSIPLQNDYFEPVKTRQITYDLNIQR